MKKIKKAVKMLSIAQACHLELTKNEDTKKELYLSSKKAKAVFALLQKENSKGSTHCLKGGRLLRLIIKLQSGTVKVGQKVKCTIGSNFVKTVESVGKVFGYSKVIRDTHIFSKNKVTQKNRYHFFTLSK